MIKNGGFKLFVLPGNKTQNENYFVERQNDKNFKLLGSLKKDKMVHCPRSFKWVHSGIIASISSMVIG